jgi:hypothetical protein
VRVSGKSQPSRSPIAHEDLNVGHDLADRMPDHFRDGGELRVCEPVPARIPDLDLEAGEPARSARDGSGFQRGSAGMSDRTLALIAPSQRSYCILRSAERQRYITQPARGVSFTPGSATEPDAGHKTGSSVRQTLPIPWPTASAQSRQACNADSF